MEDDVSESLQEFLAIGFCVVVPVLLAVCFGLRWQLDKAIEQRNEALKLYRSTNETWTAMYGRARDCIRNLKKELELRRSAMGTHHSRAGEEER
jgi:hypothetical protein